MRRRAAVASVVSAAALGAVLCAGAGTMAWRGAWLWSVLFAATGVIGAYVIPTPVLAERLRGPIRSGQSKADVVFVAVIAPLLLGWFVLVALDARFGWSDVPVALRGIGIALFVAANAVAIGALRANPFASASVRIDPDHRVATAGPYRVVRHPMYAGVVLYFPGSALVLGSLAGALATIAIVAAFVVRIGIEERTLRAELPGYADYATSVRWRLVPGVW